MNKTFSRVIAFAVLAVAANLSLAAGEEAVPPSGQPPPGDARVPRHGPPREAVEACAGKQDGVACSFTAPHGSMSGTCHMVREGKMACVPPRGTEPPGGRPGGLQQGPRQ